MNGSMNKIQQVLEENERELIEKGANLEHDRWARWQKYMFSKMTEEEKFEEGKHFKTGNYVLNKELVDRWFRQIDTPYSELSELEKESDRKETRNYLPLVNTIQLRLIEAFKEMIEDKLKELPNLTFSILLAELEKVVKEIKQ